MGTCSMSKMYKRQLKTSLTMNAQTSSKWMKYMMKFVQLGA